MKKTQIALAGTLTLASFVKTSFPALAQPTSQAISEVFQKADLPDGGTLLPDPAHKQIDYYYLNNDRLRLYVSNQNKLAGLYGSTDEGRTWQRLNNEFEFENLFVHPVTGELFAVVANSVYNTDENGILHSNRYRKAISSVDGKRWKDLMRKQPPVGWISGISLDPEHPNRIRLSGRSWNRFCWVAVDDNYSDWKRIEIPNGPVF